ncbi:MAG: hypothetical protein KJS79_16835 [Rhodospirillales bacterium]|nr:hypothetical protein [Rhodospirillales bacterium]
MFTINRNAQFDAHDRAFAFFRGACTRGIYDNMKTAVEAIFTGKVRIPIEAGQVFRGEAGHRSDLKPAGIPISFRPPD